MKQKSKKRRLFGLLGMREQMALTIGIFLLLCTLFVCLNHKWKRIAALQAKNVEKATLHEEWKGKKSGLEEEFHQVVQHVMKQEKVDQTHLMERVEAAARETRVRYELDPPVTVNNGIFENHKVDVRLQNASMDDLLVFDEKVEPENVNVRVDEMEIIGGRNGEISTKVTVSALDLMPEDDLLQEVADILETPELLEVHGTSALRQTLNAYE